MRKLPVRKLSAQKLPTRKLLWAAVAGALFLPFEGFTLGLGEIEVSSALNQKLSADIELLSATAEDTENIIIKLASRKDFSRAGLDRPYLLNDLRFKPVVVNGVPHIKVSSGSPIREPFLNFLMEVDWPNGHLLREYTVLLDPPVFMMQPSSSASVSPAQAAGGDDFRPASGSSANVVPVVVPGGNLSSRPESAVQPVNQVSSRNRFASAPVATTAFNQPAGSYKIKSGDTAWSLADSMRPDQSVTVEQMMIAMLRTNPESFINENINGLKRGYILRTPDYNEITSISQADARALVREQAALWRQVQKTQSAGQPVSAMPADGSASSSGVAGAEAATDDAYLEIVSAGGGSSTGSAKDPTKMTAAELRAELALARERVETERVEKEALQQRVESLESNVDTMKGMLSIEDDGLSSVQSLNMPDGEETSEMLVDDSGLTEEEIAARQELLEALETESAEDMAGDEVADAEMAIDEAADSEIAETGEDEAAAESEEAVFVDETDMTEAASDMPAEPETTAPISSPIVDSPEPDPLSKLLSDPILLAAAGGGLLLVIALIALLIKRRKAASTTDDTGIASADDGIDDLESLADDVAADTESDASDEAEDLVEDFVDRPADDTETESEGFDSDSTMVLNPAEDTIMTEAADVAEAAEDEPRDDVIAEADVYLAYGIYQQAEELLTQAIADNPDRDDYRVKLAETHYASKSVEPFIEVASEIRQRAESDDVPAWKKVMVMGQDLCPDEAMFKGSMIGGVDVDSLAPKAPEMDFDLGINEAESDVTPDLDLSLDDDLELPEMDDLDSDAGSTSDSAMDETAIIDADATQIMGGTDAADEIEFDINDTGAVEESSDAEDEFSLDIDASELDIDIQDEIDETPVEEESLDIGDMDIGLDDSDSTDSSTDEEHDIEDVDIDFGLDDTADKQADDDEADAADESEIAIDLTDEAAELDMDFGELESDDSGEDVGSEIEIDMEEGAEPEIDVPMDIDIGDIDIEADSESANESIDVGEEVSESAGDEMDDDFDLSSLDDVDEVSTKLDLARAYLDMGDHEGSRGILEEVLAEGNDEQKKEASELIAKLD